MKIENQEVAHLFSECAQKKLVLTDYQVSCIQENLYTPGSGQQKLHTTMMNAFIRSPKGPSGQPVEHVAQFMRRETYTYCYICGEGSNSNENDNSCLKTCTNDGYLNTRESSNDLDETLREFVGSMQNLLYIKLLVKERKDELHLSQKRELNLTIF
uniref:Uncharacterized protein n=1 Tax=Rhizophora mucronata TaxID=61149 RepID=A0A2P2P5U0_RHIMU